MRIYKKYTGAVTDSVIITKASESQLGNIYKVLITNAHASTTGIRLYIDDGTTEFNLLATKIPGLTSLVLTENLKYDHNIYDLKVTLDTAGYDITIIIK